MEMLQQVKQYFDKRWAKVLAIGIIVLAVVVSILPVIVRMVIEDWYKDQGVESAKIEDVDLNLFTGTFALEGVEVRDDGQVVLSMASTAINLSWLDLLSRQLHVEELDVKEFSIRVERPEDGPVKVAGITLGGDEATKNEQPAEKGEPWGVGITVTRIENFLLNYRDEKIDSQFALRKVNLNNALTWTPDNKAVLSLNGEINNSPVSINAEFKPFAASPTFQGKLKVEGVELDNFAELAKPNVTGLSGKFHMDTAVDITLKDKKLLDAKAQGVYQLESVALDVDKRKIALGALKLEGAASVMQPLGGEEEKKTSLKFAGSTSGQMLSVIDKEANIRLVELAKLAINSIDVNGIENVGVANVSLDQLVLLEDNQLEELNVDEKSQPQAVPPVTTVESINIEKIQLNELNSLTVENVSLIQVRVNISKEKNGEIQLLGRLSSDEKKADKKQVKEDAKLKSGADDSKNQNAGNQIEEPAVTGNREFKFKIGSVKVSDKSNIIYKDASVLPKFESNVEIRQLEVNNIDNTSKQSESPFILKAKINKYSDFDIKGKLNLFSGDNDFSFAANFKNYELPPLSSYTSQILGYDLSSGQGNIKVHAEKKKDKIDGEAKLRLNNFTVKETNPEHMKKLNEQLSIPLDMALSLLRDKNDDIKLTIPVTGELLKPDVGLGDIINTALGNALKSSTMAYLKFAFQPYGTLISIVQAAGSAASSIQLDPIMFPVANSDLRTEDSEYLQKIAKLVQDKKGIRIKLCGISAPGDRAEMLRLATIKQAEELAKQKNKSEQTKDGKLPPPVVSDDDMFELARKRAESVKDYLMKNFNIDPARLFVCHPEIKKEQEAKPVVELKL